MARQPMKDLIVVIPGIMGSVLEKDGRVAWGYSGRSLVRTLFTGGRSIRDALALAEDPPDVDDLGDGVVPTRLMPDLHLLPGFWKIDGYTKLRDTLHATFDLTDGANYLELPYDWRRTNVVAARRLERTARDGLRAWRERSGNAGARLVLVAHSMGGLVSRYFLEVLEGWKITRALVTFGTPYRGSLNAVDTLVHGVRKGPRGLLDLTELSRSLTSIYELLPIYPAYDPGDGALARVAEQSDVPNVDPERAAAALAFHRAIEEAVEENRTNDEYRAGRYEIFPVVGIQQPTWQSAVREEESVRLLRSWRGEDMSGDGTVPRVSAVPLEESDANLGMFAATRHGSLQNADAALVQLEGVITGMRLDLGSFRSPAARVRETAVALEVGDVHFDDEAVELRARPAREDAVLTATVVDSLTGSRVAELEMRAEDGWHRAEAGPLPEGSYRVRVTGEHVLPVEDSFAVGGPEEP